METPLAARLHAHHVEALLAQAQFIRDHPPGGERTEQAERYVRQAMYERTIGRITAEQESRIFSLLSFVMPDGWRATHPTPIDVLKAGSPDDSHPACEAAFSLAATTKPWYDNSMTPKVTDEIRQALQHSNGPIRIEDDQTHKFYVIVDTDTHKRAMQALKKQEDLDAVQAGIAAMEAGRTILLAEADERIRRELEFRPIEE